MLSHVRLFETPWTVARQGSLSITNSWGLLRLMSIELVMPPNHLILCRPPLLLPSIFHSSRVFSNESVLSTRWPKCWSFSFSISPSNEYSGLIPLGWIGCFDPLQPHGLYSPLNSPDQNTGVGYFHPQGISPTQGLNPGLPHFRLILYQLSHQGSPNGHEFEQTQGDIEVQENQSCCSPWSHKELDMTEQLN